MECLGSKRVALPRMSAAHWPDLSLSGPVGALPNGTVLYTYGFGLRLGDRVTWRFPGARGPAIEGAVAAIFEHGQAPTVSFQPDEGVARWVAPHHLRKTSTSEGGAALVLMPCSASKLCEPAPAARLYTGVMWQTLRHQMRRPPYLMVLSARHGFLSPSQIVEPYDHYMTPRRAYELLRIVERQCAGFEDALSPASISDVLLVGGRAYREVMRAWIQALKVRGVLPSSATVQETQGSIGEQRRQLGAYLRARA